MVHDLFVGLFLRIILCRLFFVAKSMMVSVTYLSYNKWKMKWNLWGITHSLVFPLNIDTNPWNGTHDYLFWHLQVAFCRKIVSKCPLILITIWICLEYWISIFNWLMMKEQFCDKQTLGDFLELALLFFFNRFKLL